MDNQNLEQLAAALNGHSITDEDGALPEENDTPPAESATADQQTTDDTTHQAEKPAEPEQSAPQAEDDELENQLGVDDSGKRYVPEKRFKDVYGKAKQLERELEALRQAQLQATLPTAKQTAPQTTPKQADRVIALEAELLKSKLPQFDPDSDQYDRGLDDLGGEIYRANPGITMLEAARRAVRFAGDIGKKVASAQSEARTVKAIQSDQGMAQRSPSRGETQLDPNKMSLEEMEEYLKANGAW